MQNKFMKKTSIVWFQKDLRLSDNPALFNAAHEGHVMAVYILDESNIKKHAMGAATKWWLHHSLKALDASLGHKLNVYQGCSKKIIKELVKKFNVDAVYWNRCYEPEQIALSQSIKQELKTALEAKSFAASLLWEPMSVAKADGEPYKVFTPYYRAALHREPEKPLPSPPKLSLVKDNENLASIDDLGLMPSIAWYRTMEKTWDIGEKAAQKQVAHFVKNGLKGYKEGRDFPQKENVSRLSPHLHFGEISPRELWHTIAKQPASLNNDIDFFHRELGWREFSHYLLYHFPSLPEKNFQTKFDKFPWRKDKQALLAWQQGNTGYPIVDAGMRELWQTGYMHNRVRMVVASFLVKNLLVHWHEGEKWFWDCLVDADLANNSASWQWVAGSGADAAPYFRIFNPVSQGEKFDPEGNYTRHFVPELKKLPNKYLFKPWEAPEKILQEAGIRLGKEYPFPIVDLDFSRTRALEAFQDLRTT